MNIIAIIILNEYYCYYYIQLNHIKIIYIIYKNIKIVYID